QPPERLQEAMIRIDHAIEVAGPEPELTDTRAIVLLAQGRAADAIAVLENAAARAPSASKFCHLALAYEKANRQEEADKAWKKAVELKLKLDDLHPLEWEQYPQVRTRIGG